MTKGAKKFTCTDLICLACFRYWQGVYPTNMDINTFRCPDCHKQEAIEFHMRSAIKILKVRGGLDKFMTKYRITSRGKDGI
jgi:hypothetical protein